MEKIKINESVLGALGLSENEGRVLDALLGLQMAALLAKVARMADMPRMTVLGVLRKLEERGLVEKIKSEKRDRWRYVRGLELYRKTRPTKNG